MNYTEAIESVEQGEYAWRAAWTQGDYIFIPGPTAQIVLYPVSGEPFPYVPSGGDEEATDWDSGDHPPK
jgi:hypothetical protein